MKKGMSILVSHAAFLAVGVMALLIISAMLWNIYDSIIREEIRKDLAKSAQTVAGEIMKLYSLKDSPAAPAANTSILLGESSLSLQQKAGGRQYSISAEENGDFQIYLKTLTLNSSRIYLSGYALYSKTGAVANGAVVNATVIENGNKNSSITNATGYFNITVFTSLTERKDYNLTIKLSDQNGKNSYLIEHINLNNSAREESNRARLVLESRNPYVKVEIPLSNIETKIQGSSVGDKPVKISYYRYNLNGAVEDKIMLDKADVFISVEGITNATMRGYAAYTNGSFFSGNVQAKIVDASDFVSNMTSNGNFTLNFLTANLTAGKLYMAYIIASDGASSGKIQKHFVYG